jgi:hypothetical protein
MVKRKPPSPEPEILVAAIEGMESTYYISELRGEVRRVDDEAILDIVGRIERHDRRRSSIWVSASSIPRLRPIVRRGGLLYPYRSAVPHVRPAPQRRLLADGLPARRRLLVLARDDLIGCRHPYRGPLRQARYGSGDLQSLCFATASNLDEIE